MSIFSKELSRFYLTLADATTVPSGQGDKGYFRDHAIPGWFECVDNTSLTADGVDIIEGRDADVFWVRIGSQNTTPGITDLIPKTYTVDDEYKANELILTTEGLAYANAHTATAQNLIDLDEVTLIGGKGAGVKTLDLSVDGEVDTIVSHQGFLWEDLGTHTGGDAFSLVNFGRLTPAVYRGDFTDTVPYLAGDRVNAASGTLVEIHEATADIEIGVPFATGTWRRVSALTFEAFADDTTYIVGDVIKDDKLTHIVMEGFTAAIGDTIDLFAVNLSTIASSEIVQPREYVDGDSIDRGEMISHAGSLYYCPVIIDGNNVAEDTWAEIESSLILVAEVAVTPTPSFDDTAAYVDADKVIFDGFTWTCKAGGHLAGPFQVANWTRAVGATTRGAFSATSVYLAGDVIDQAGILSVAKTDLDAAVFDAVNWTRITVKFFDVLPVSEDVIVGDTVLAEGNYLRCKTAYTAGAADLLTDVLVNYHVLSGDGKVKLRSYVVDEEFEVGELIEHTEGFFYVKTAFDGTTVATTFEGILPNLTVLKSIPATPSVPFVTADTYAEGDLVTYEGEEFTRNAAVRPASVAFSLDHFDFVRTETKHHGEFVQVKAFMAGDCTIENGIEYIATVATVDTAIEPANWQRLTPIVFSVIPATPTGYIVGDTLVVDNKYFLCTTAVVAPSTVDPVRDAEFTLLIDAETIVGREYVDGSDLEKGEVFQYLGNLYYAPNAINGAAAGTDTWAEIEADMILVAQVPVTPTPAFDDTATYSDGDEVLFDGFKWTCNSGGNSAGPFLLTNWTRSTPGGVKRGVHDAASVYLTGDEVTLGGLSYRSTSDQEVGTFDGAEWDRLTTRHFSTLPVSEEVIIGDTVLAGKVYLRCSLGYDAGPADLLGDVVANFEVLSDETKSIIRSYADDEAFEVGEVIEHMEGYFYVKVAFDGTVTATDFDTIAPTNLDTIKAIPEAPIVAHDDTLAYLTSDQVIMDGRIWEARTDVLVNTPFSVAEWKLADAVKDHGPFADTILFGLGDSMSIDDLTYVALVAVDPAVYDETKFTRVESGIFDTPVDDFEFIKDDIIRDGDKVYVVKDAFTIASGSETIDDHLAALLLVSNDEHSKLVTYVDGIDLEAQTLFVYDDGVYYTPNAVDGTLSQSDTWEEIKTQVSLIGALESVILDFDQALGYAEGDVVKYKDFLFTRNAAPRTGGDPLSLTEFDRMIPAGFDHGPFVADIPYLTGDIVEVAGIKYTSFGDSDNIASFAEGSTNGKFERITASEFTSYPATATRFIQGDKLYLDKRSFYVKATFTTADSDTVDAHLANLAVISDDLVNLTREYTDGESFEAGEFLTYLQNLYFVDTAWVADLTPGAEASHNWAEVEANCTLISSVGTVAPVAFDKADTYAINTVVTFEGLLYTRNAMARSANDEFSITQFDRNKSAGLRLGAISTSSPYLAGDIVTVAGKDYRINEDVDYNIAGDTVFTEALVGANTYARVNAEVFNAVEDDKVYIAEDVILDGKLTYMVTGSFVSGNPADLSTEANAVLISNDRDLIAPTFDDAAEYAAGSQFQDAQVLYFVHTEITVPGTIDTHADKIAAISDKPKVAPSNFDSANAYAEGDRVNFQGFIWERNAESRTASTPFSIVEFDREPVDLGIVQRGDFAAGEHLLTGDHFDYEGIEYVALADKDVTTDTPTDAWTAFAPTAERVGNMSFVELEATADYVKNDLFRIERHTFIANKAFTTTADLSPESYPELTLLTQDDRSVIRDYEDGMSLHKEELFIHNGDLYLTIAEIDGTVSTDWVTVETDVKLVAGLPVFEFSAPETYTEGAKVSYLGYVYARNATARTGGDAFSIVHFDRVESNVAHGLMNVSQLEPQVLLVGDTFVDSDGVTYEIEQDWDAGVPISAINLNDTYKRLTPKVHATIAAGREYIVGDTFTQTHWTYRATADFVSPSTTIEDSIANLEAIDITETYYLAADDVIAYHDHQKKGHTFVVEEDYTVSELGIMLKRGDRLILRSTKTSSDTPALEDFDLYGVKVIETEEVVATGIIAEDNEPGAKYAAAAAMSLIDVTDIITWDKVVSVTQASDIVSVTVNGFDKTSRFTWVDATTLTTADPLYSGDVIVVTYS